MIASQRFLVLSLLAVFSLQTAFAAGLMDEGVVQPQDYPGYCLQNWQDEVFCMDGSREPWRGPQLVPAAVQILAPQKPNARTIAQRHHCGAVLIAPDWALTAAHCVSGARVTRGFEIGIGYADRETGDMIDKGVALPIREVVLHPDYRTKKIDLALVRFAEDARVHIANPTYSPLIDPQLGTVQLVFPRPLNAAFPAPGEPDVRFADAHGGQAPPAFKANSVLFRWSRLGDDRFRLVKTPLFELTAAICNQQTGAEFAIEDQNFCALSRDRPLCPSDSGAPVMGGIESGHYNSRVGDDRGMPHALLVAAIATWDRDGCAAPGEPGQFILVRPHRKWIRTVVKESYDKRKEQSERIADRRKWDGAR